MKNILPEEILLEIFSEIDKSNLGKFLEISSEWRGLLIKNVKVMRKLPLILMNNTWKQKLEFAEKYGKFIREVDFVGVELDSFEDVAKVLRLTPNVEKLKLINLKMRQIENSGSEENPENEEENLEKQIEKVFMKNLREITVQDELNVGALKFVASQLIVQMTSLICDLNDDANCSTLEHIMTENRELRSLEIFTNIDEIFNPTEDILEGFSCKLRKLLIKSSVLSYNEQFVKFLKLQTDLNEIGMLAGHVDTRYHQMMFTTFPKVNRIQLNVDALGTSDCLEKLQKVPSNKSIESLSLLGKNLHLNIFDTLLKLSPKVHQLHIENMTHFYSHKIGELPLTYLRVDCAKKDFVNTQQLTQSAKVQVCEVVQQEIYERNLQNFCVLPRFTDKQNVIEAF